MKFADGGDVGNEYPRPGVMAEPLEMEPERFVPQLPGFIHMADGGDAGDTMREKVAALKAIDTGGVQPWSAGENFPMFVYRAGLPGGGEGFRGSYLHAQDYEKAPTPYRRTYDEALEDAQNLLKMFRGKKLPKFQSGGLSQLVDYSNRGLQEARGMRKQTQERLQEDEVERINAFFDAQRERQYAETKRKLLQNEGARKEYESNLASAAAPARVLPDVAEHALTEGVPAAASMMIPVGLGRMGLMAFKAPGFLRSLSQALAVNPFSPRSISAYSAMNPRFMDMPQAVATGLTMASPDAEELSSPLKRLLRP